MLQFTVFLSAYTLSQFFRSFLAVIAPDLTRDLHLDATQLGTISAAWFVTFALAQFPVGILLDRVGPRRTVSAIMLFASAGAALLGVADSALLCTLAMGLIGIGCSPVYMGALYYFGRTYPAHRFALLSSWLIAIGSAGNLLAATPLAFAARELGWRASFLGVAAVTLAAAVLVVLLVEDPPRAEKPKDAPKTGLLHEFGEILSMRVLWPMIPMILVSYAVVVTERGLWMGPFLADVWGLDALARGNVALVMSLAMSAGALVYGPLDHWLGTAKWVVFGGALITIAALLALALAEKPSVAVATALLSLTGGAGISYAVLMAHARPFFPEHLLGRGITFCNFLFIGGASLLQPLSGRYVDALKAQGLPAETVYSRLHLAFAVTLAVATAIYAFSREKRR